MSDDLVKRLLVGTGGGKHWMDLHEEAASRIENLESKLEKAREALSEAACLLDPGDEDITKGTGLYRIVTTLKELKGQIDE